MSFISVSFLIFHLIVLLFRFAFRKGGPNTYFINGMLLLSLIFYGWHAPEYLLIILTCVVTNYAAGRLLAGLPSPDRISRRLVISATICICVGLLAYFKYAAFIANLLGDLIGYKIPSESKYFGLSILLPIGISFYTFQSLSYTIDVYRGKQTAEHNFSRFALFVIFFPQLVAGPIVRANQFLYQLGRKRGFQWPVFMEGCYLILRGLFLKLVIADNLGQVVDQYWTSVSRPDAPSTLALSLVVFFSCQIYCDFAGYTDIARGIAYQLGFRLPVNFNAPYLAKSFSEFWRRWHITLSQWMKDYLYIPLGGSRRGGLRTCRNLVIVFVLSGLWHGAGLNFVLWGAMHGIAIAIERVINWTTWFENCKSRSFVAIGIGLFGFLVVQSTWIMSMALFRASDCAEAWQMLQRSVYGVVALPLEGVEYPGASGKIITAWGFTIPVWYIHLRTYLQQRFCLRLSVYERTAYAGIMCFAVLSLYAGNPKFIYFQF